MRCRWELKWHKFGLSHHRPAAFGTAQWQDPDRVSAAYVLYRAIIFIYFWSFFVYDIMKDYTEVSISYYMIYLTNWTYITAVVDIAVQFLSAVTAAFRSRNGIKPLVPEWLYKTHWVIVNISHTIAPLVTIMYWGGVFPFLDYPVTYADLHLHLLTTLYTLADLFIHGTPRRFHHVVYPLCFGVAYLLFSIVYYLCGGVDGEGNTGIYPILDWAEPGLSTGTAVVACLLVGGLHAATWAAVKLRLKLHGSWRGRQVTVEAGVDIPSGGSAGGSGGGSGGGTGSGGEGAGSSEPEREAYISVDVGDSAHKPELEGNSSGDKEERPSGAERDAHRAFDNGGLVTDEDGNVLL